MASRWVVSAIDFDQYRMGDCGMLNRERSAALGAVAIASLLMVGGPARAQQPAAPAAVIVAGPAVGDVAPDFTLDGATRYGLLKTPVRLADYRGRTVVLAFFYQARTKG
jgi:cytochrome oxidase Cu insertion factor (SCO1/SenC/PrrC family)